MTSFSSGISDLTTAWQRRQVAIYFAWTETLARYRRSVLGPFWLVGSTAIGVLGLAYVWGTLFKAEQSEFIPSLTTGLVLWQFISGVLGEAPGVFPRNAHTILNVRLPSFLLSGQMLLRHLINFAHNLLVVMLVFAIYPQHISWTALLAIPGFFIVGLTLLGSIQLLGFLGARYRDIEPLFTSFLPILFFLSPVIYQARQLGDAAFIMQLNPVAHWIHLVRDPLLGNTPTLENYVMASGLCLLVWIGAVWITGSRGHRLPYWV